MEALAFIETFFKAVAAVIAVFATLAATFARITKKLGT
jgi:hypothetical protein